MNTVVKQFVATVNGTQRQVLVTLPREYAGDVEYAWGIIVENDHYWNLFWEGADGADWTGLMENRRLVKVTT